MTPPRSVKEWAAKCHDAALTGMRVEGKSWGHLRHGCGLCVECALCYAAAYAAEQVAQARGDIRKEIVQHFGPLVSPGHEYSSACCELWWWNE